VFVGQTSEDYHSGRTFGTNNAYKIYTKEKQFSTFHFDSCFVSILYLNDNNNINKYITKEQSFLQVLILMNTRLSDAVFLFPVIFSEWPPKLNKNTWRPNLFSK
jgi:hypothetical protein